MPDRGRAGQGRPGRPPAGTLAPAFPRGGRGGRDARSGAGRDLNGSRSAAPKALRAPGKHKRDADRLYGGVIGCRRLHLFT